MSMRSTFPSRQLPSSQLHATRRSKVGSRFLEATGWYRGVEVVADEIGRTQTLIAEVLREHDATLDEPPPMVLVDVRGSATVNLKAHFWIDGRTISPQRIRSSALRLIKCSLVEHGVSMPDEAREIIFPQGVPLVRMKPDGTEPDKMSVALTASAAGGPPPSAAEPNLEATSAEGGLGNEMTELPQNASEGTIPEASSGNLLLNR